MSEAGVSKIEKMALDMRTAMKGWGCDDKGLIEVVGRLDVADIDLVKASFNAQFNRDLIADLKDETSRLFEDALVAFCTPLIEFDADCLHKAMKGLGTDIRCMVDIICTREPEEIKEIKKVYARKYTTDVEDDMREEMKLNEATKRLFGGILRGFENDESQWSIDLDVKKLYEAGEGKVGTDRNIFATIIGSRNKEYLIKLDKAYADAHGNNLVTAIEKEVSRDFQSALKARVKPNAQYFAERLYKAMKGAGCDDQILIRTFASQRDRHFPQIVDEFLRMYQKTLKGWLDDEISSMINGDYKKLMFAVYDHQLENEKKRLAFIEQEEKARKERERDLTQAQIEAQRKLQGELDAERRRIRALESAAVTLAEKAQNAIQAAKAAEQSAAAALKRADSAEAKAAAETKQREAAELKMKLIMEQRRSVGKYFEDLKFGDPIQPMMLLDVTGSMDFQAAANTKVTRKAVVEGAMMTIVSRLSEMDSERSAEGKDAKDGGLRTVTFANNTATDIGALNPQNLKVSFGKIRWDGGTYIMPGWNKLMSVYDSLHGKKSINDRPANLALVITDGEAVDGAEFEKALKAIPDEQWKKLYIVFALIGYGSDYDNANKRLAALSAFKKNHIEVLPFDSSTDPAAIALKVTNFIV